MEEGVTHREVQRMVWHRVKFIAWVRVLPQTIFTIGEEHMFLNQSRFIRFLDYLSSFPHTHKLSNTSTSHSLLHIFVLTDSLWNCGRSVKPKCPKAPLNRFVATPRAILQTQMHKYNATTQCPSSLIFADYSQDTKSITYESGIPF